MVTAEHHDESADHRYTQIGAHTRHPNERPHVQSFRSPTALSGCKRFHCLKCKEPRMRVRKGQQNVRQNTVKRGSAEEAPMQTQMWPIMVVSGASASPADGASDCRRQVQCSCTKCASSRASLPQMSEKLHEAQHSSTFASTLLNRPVHQDKAESA